MQPGLISSPKEQKSAVKESDKNMENFLTNFESMDLQPFAALPGVSAWSLGARFTESLGSTSDFEDIPTPSLSSASLSSQCSSPNYDESERMFGFDPTTYNDVFYAEDSDEDFNIKDEFASNGFDYSSANFAWKSSSTDESPPTQRLQDLEDQLYDDRAFRTLKALLEQYDYPIRLAGLGNKISFLKSEDLGSPAPPPDPSVGELCNELFLKEREVDAGVIMSPNPIDLEKVKTETGSEESMETGSITASLPQPKIKRKKRKYVKRDSARKSIQLYQFMLRLLDDRDECVTWVSREDGVFKLLKSKNVAKLWGKYKKNANMTYESLSRALRHYYAQEILSPVPKKLHYKFCKKTLDDWYQNSNTLGVKSTF